MADRIQIGVRYCGGCNPRYDRVAAVQRLRELLPEAELAPAAPGQRAALVVCGCPARCAGVDGLTGPLLYITGPEDVMSAAEKLARLLEGGRTDARI